VGGGGTFEIRTDNEFSKGHDKDLDPLTGNVSHEKSPFVLEYYGRTGQYFQAKFLA
jgi:hypothetical protein